MTSLDDLALAVIQHEALVPAIKPDNGARVVFHEREPHRKRPFSVVYLHGLTASQGEGAPTHATIADLCGAHLYLARLSGHGTDLPDAMRGVTANQWRDDARRALDVGLALGEQVILMGTSMGATLALDLAAMYPASIAAVLAYSPGIRPYDPAQLSAAVEMQGAVAAQGERSLFQQRYWSSMVHTDAYRAVASLFSERMTADVLGHVTCPVFFGVWDGGEGDRDTLTSVTAMRDAFGWLGTPAASRRLVAYDHAAHVLASPQRSAAAGRVLYDSGHFLRGNVLLS